MKKSILLLVLLVATVVNATPRFGVIGVQNEGVGVFLTDDMYNAQLTFTNKSDDATPKTEKTTITIGGNYKVAVDSVTALTFGASYTIFSGKESGVDVKDNNSLALNAGIERALSSNVVLTATVDAFREIKVSGFKTTQLLSNGRLGVAYLF